MQSGPRAESATMSACQDAQARRRRHRSVRARAFRFNERGGTDADRFVKTMQQIQGRRIMFKDLTGGHGDEPELTEEPIF